MLTDHKKTGFKQTQACKAALSEMPSNQSGAKCNFCDRHHAFGRNNCPASGKTCKACGKRGHFAVKCHSTQKKGTPDGNNQTMRTSRKLPPRVKQVVELKMMILPVMMIGLKLCQLMKKIKLIHQL